MHGAGGDPCMTPSEIRKMSAPTNKSRQIDAWFAQLSFCIQPGLCLVRIDGQYDLPACMSFAVAGPDEIVALVCIDATSVKASTKRIVCKERRTVIAELGHAESVRLLSCTYATTLARGARAIPLAPQYVQRASVASVDQLMSSVPSEEPSMRVFAYFCRCSDAAAAAINHLLSTYSMRLRLNADVLNDGGMQQENQGFQQFVHMSQGDASHALAATLVYVQAAVAADEAAACRRAAQIAVKEAQAAERAFSHAATRVATERNAKKERRRLKRAADAAARECEPHTTHDAAQAGISGLSLDDSGVEQAGGQSLEQEHQRGEQMASDECAICMTRIGSRAVLVPCGHGFCAACAEALVKRRKCPTCRADVSSAMRVFF